MPNVPIEPEKTILNIGCHLRRNHRSVYKSCSTTMESITPFNQNTSSASLLCTQSLSQEDIGLSQGQSRYRGKNGQISATTTSNALAQRGTGLSQLGSRETSFNKEIICANNLTVAGNNLIDSPMSGVQFSPQVHYQHQHHHQQLHYQHLQLQHQHQQIQFDQQSQLQLSPIVSSTQAATLMTSSQDRCRNGMSGISDGTRGVIAISIPVSDCSWVAPGFGSMIKGRTGIISEDAMSPASLATEVKSQYQSPPTLP